MKKLLFLLVLLSGCCEEQDCIHKFSKWERADYNSQDRTCELCGYTQRRRLTNY